MFWYKVYCIIFVSFVLVRFSVFWLLQESSTLGGQLVGYDSKSLYFTLWLVYFRRIWFAISDSNLHCVLLYDFVNGYTGDKSSFSEGEEHHVSGLIKNIYEEKKDPGNDGWFFVAYVIMY